MFTRAESMQQSPDEVIRSQLENDEQKRIILQQVYPSVIKYIRISTVKTNFILFFQFKEAVKDCQNDLFDCGDEYLVKWLIGCNINQFNICYLFLKCFTLIVFSPKL